MPRKTSPLAFWSSLLLLLTALVFSIGTTPSVAVKGPSFSNSPALPEMLQGKPCQLTLMDFYSPHCSACKAMKPYVETLKSTYGKGLQVIHVNLSHEANQDYGRRYQIRYTPTYVLFNGKGLPVARIEGANPDGLAEALSAQTVQNKGAATGCAVK